MPEPVYSICSVMNVFPIYRYYMKDLTYIEERFHKIHMRSSAWFYYPSYYAEEARFYPRHVLNS